MVRLTSIGNVEVCNGEPTSVYIDPWCIALVNRAYGAWNTCDPNLKNEKITCTTVWLRGAAQANILVLETPEEVAQRRDAALDIPTRLEAVK